MSRRYISLFARPVEKCYGREGMILAVHTDNNLPRVGEKVG